MTDWKKERRNVVNHSLALVAPHSILYKIVKNAGTITLKKHTENRKYFSLRVFRNGKNIFLDIYSAKKFCTLGFWSELYLDQDWLHLVL